MNTEKQTSLFKRSSSAQRWRENLSSKIPLQLTEEIDDFEKEIFLKSQGKIDDKIFAETRLRRGVYGQRYDNGKRHNGKETKVIPYPDNLTKGPDTLWHAPGMLRIKIPYGGLNYEQIETIADLAEEYSDCICHITTRQDIQLHFVHIEDNPSIFRRLAAVGITTREACGNSVRNVTACPIAGVCHEETFDVTPYADAIFRFLLGHPDVQDFGRKFKIAFSGCQQNPCGLTGFHDLGLIAKTREENGKTKRGFAYYVGGGLGPVPYQAKLLKEFVSEEELLPLTQAVCRIFARHGEKQKRSRARIKFLVNDWGIEKFTQAVLKERELLKKDVRWTDYIAKVDLSSEEPLKTSPGILSFEQQDPEFQTWFKTNVRPQQQKGYYVVTLPLPLGDISSQSFRDLATLAKKYIQDTIRTTVEQNLILRWVEGSDLPALFEDLKKIHLADPVADTIVDITSCPGTDTCKLGNASSRGLASVLRMGLAQKAMEMDEAVRNLKIKISGCFNSCGQHHVSDIGFYGISRKSGSHVVPHFQLVLGGQWTNNAASFGLGIGGIPSKSIPKTVDRLCDWYLKGKNQGELFREFINRKGKLEVKKQVFDLMEIPPYEKDPSYYTDWGDIREFTTSDIGIGECAGEVVSLVDFALKEADRKLFEAQIQLDEKQYQASADTAFQAMLHAAQGLLKGSNPDISNDEATILKEFKEKFCDTQLFHHPFAGDKFANYLFKNQKIDFSLLSPEQIRQLVEESQLFIEAAYHCNVKMSMQS